MIDEHIDYKAKADEVFNYYENKVFERSRYDLDRDYDLVFSFSDWVRDLDTDYILEIVDFDLKDPDDVEKACEKLIKIINNGVDKWLGNPVDDLIKDLKRSGIMDNKFYEEENRLLRQLAKHWEEMYNNLLKEHEELVKEYDNLVQETIERDSKC